MSWPPMPGMSAVPKLPGALCCIAPACAMASAAVCLACLALSKSPIAPPPAQGKGRSRNGTPGNDPLQTKRPRT